MDLMGMIGGLTGGGSSEHSGIANALLEHIGSNPDGLSGLLQGFQNSGLGDKVNSWVGIGQNQQVSPDEVEQGLGSNQLDQIASRAGVSPGIAKTGLAAILPMVVDHLTPDGQVPQGGALSGMIGQLLGRAA
jgi:uncharacterized protein YidB (DUF937 family)